MPSRHACTRAVPLVSEPAARLGLAFAIVMLAACDREGHRTPVTQGECYTCHVADYESTTDPPHSGSFPTTCGDCHSTDAWRPASGGAHPEDRFAIATGQHAALECGSCHDASLGSNLAGANTNCVGCHGGAHQRAAMDERHRGLTGYPIGDAPPNFCLTCHPNGNADVAPHPEERFPLATTQHAIVACLECHDTSLGSSIAGANTDCVGCHSGEHERAAMDLRHRGVHIPLYPTGPAAPNFCLNCHPTGQAPIALHPEAAFPIDSGGHEPFACGDCHDPELGSNVGGANSDCVGCHTGEHTRASTDGRHAGVTGYPAGTAAPNFCLTCHPSGSAASAAHPETAFPIAMGNHTGMVCGDCHDATLGSSIGGANTDCVGCHSGTHARAAMDTRHAGVSGYPTGAAPPNFCLTCHPAGNADSVGHPDDRFRISGGAHSPFTCNECHNPALGPNTAGMNADCIGCHTGQHTRSRVDGQHREERDYAWDAAHPNFCLTCHPGGRS